jgi:hypothetical protein
MKTLRTLLALALVAVFSMMAEGREVEAHHGSWHTHLHYSEAGGSTYNAQAHSGAAAAAIRCSLA